MNGDGKSEVWALNRTQDNRAFLILAALGPAETAWGTQFPRVDIRSGGPVALASGDMDADGRDEMALCERRDSSGDNDCLVLGVAASSASGSTSIVGKKHWNPLQGATKLSPLMVMGDFDGDSLKLQFTGSCSTVYSTPRPLVAMAAPPVADSIQGAYIGNSNTEYGTSQTKTQSQSNSVTESDSVTLSVETPDLFDLFSASTSATFGREFTKTKTTSTSVTVGQDYTAYWDDTNPVNSVLYMVTPYTSYKYQILAGPDPKVYSTDGKNKYMTIDVPSSPKQYFDSQAVYNAAIANSNATNKADLTIGSETFPETVGQPLTYRSPQACDNLLAANGGPYNGWRGPFEPNPVREHHVQLAGRPQHRDDDRDRATAIAGDGGRDVDRRHRAGGEPRVQQLKHLLVDGRARLAIPGRCRRHRFHRSDGHQQRPLQRGAPRLQLLENERGRLHSHRLLHQPAVS